MNEPDKEKKKKYDKGNHDDFVFTEERLKQFNKVLLGYISVCNNSNNSSQGNKTILAFRKAKNKKPGSLYVNQTYVYNAQLEQFAKECDTKSLFVLTQHMKKEQIRCDHQTYAYIYYCVGKMNINDEQKLGNGLQK